METKAWSHENLINKIAFRLSIDLWPEEMYAFVLQYADIDRLYYHSEENTDCIWIFKTHYENAPLYCQLNQDTDSCCCPNMNILKECNANCGEYEVELPEEVELDFYDCRHHLESKNYRYKLFMTRSLEIFIRCIKCDTEEETRLLIDELKIGHKLLYEDFNETNEVRHFLRVHGDYSHHTPPRQIFLKLVGYDADIVDRPWEVYQKKKNEEDVFRKLIKVIRVYMTRHSYCHHTSHLSTCMQLCEKCSSDKEDFVCMPQSVYDQYYGPYMSKYPFSYRIYLRKNFIDAPTIPSLILPLVHSIDIPIDEKVYDSIPMILANKENHHLWSKKIFKTTWEGEPLYCQLVEQRDQSQCRLKQPSDPCGFSSSRCLHHESTSHYSYKLFMTRYPGLLACVMWCSSWEERKEILSWLKNEIKDEFNEYLMKKSETFREYTRSICDRLLPDDDVMWLKTIIDSQFVDEPWHIFIPDKTADELNLRTLIACSGVFLQRRWINNVPVYNDACIKCPIRGKKIIPYGEYHAYYSAFTMSYFREYLHRTYKYFFCDLQKFIHKI